MGKARMDPVELAIRQREQKRAWYWRNKPKHPKKVKRLDMLVKEDISWEPCILKHTWGWDRPDMVPVTGQYD